MLQELSPSGAKIKDDNWDTANPAARRNLYFFQQRLLHWQSKCSSQFPWRKSTSSFDKLIAHLLLQWTNIGNLVEHYETIIKDFPTKNLLTSASLSRIRKAIKPLGIAHRAKSLKQFFQISDDAALDNFELDAATIKRLYSRFFGISAAIYKKLSVSDLLSFFSLSCSPKNRRMMAEAIFDFTKTICTLRSPKCRCCPLAKHCSSKSKFATDQILALDVFSGAGGLSMGAKLAGAKVAYAFEKDRNAARTHEFNFPDSAVVKEFVTTASAVRLCKSLGLTRGSIDLVLAGPPCQGFSISNLRTRDQSNPANHAWKSVIKIVSHLRPKGVVIENVGGIETYQNGAVVKTIERSLQKMGYTVKRYCLDAIDFGVPQHRKRVFFVAVSHNVLPETIRPTVAEPLSVGAALGDLPRVPNGNKKDNFLYRLNGRALTKYQRQMRRGANGSVMNCKTSENTDLILRRFAHVRQGKNWADIPNSLFLTYSKKENCHRWLYRRLAETQPSVTISNFRKNMLIHPWQNRTLSVREAARLQSLHDRFILFGNLQSQQQQVANAVPPPVGKAVVGIIVRQIRRNRCRIPAF